MPISTISQAGLNAPITLTSPTLTTPNINSAQFATVTGTAPLYAARAWVNFNGTGTVAIRGSGNVSSITDNGTGDYTVNFTNAMPDANYNVVASANRATTVDTYLSGMVPNPTGQFTSSCRVGGRDYNSTQDCVYCNVAIFR
jgi:hypothetical protein